MKGRKEGEEGSLEGLEGREWSSGRMEAAGDGLRRAGEGRGCCKAKRGW